VNFMANACQNCVDCGRRLWFHERVAYSQILCIACAAGRGVIRLADHPIIMGQKEKFSTIPKWWRWTAWLGYATYLKMVTTKTAELLDEVNRLAVLSAAESDLI
jgi:hypothetical protein